MKEKREKKDREEVTAEKEATLGAAEAAAEEVMAEAAEEGEATAAAAVEAAAEGMIVDPTAGRTETADQHPSKRGRKSM